LSNPFQIANLVSYGIHDEVSFTISADYVKVASEPLFPKNRLSRDLNTFSWLSVK